MSIFSIRKLALGVAVVAGSALAVDPAGAAPLEREHYSGTDSVLVRRLRLPDRWHHDIQRGVHAQGGP